MLCLVHRRAGPAVRPALRELVPAHCTAGGKVLLSERHRWCESQPTWHRRICHSAAGV